VTESEQNEYLDQIERADQQNAGLRTENQQLRYQINALRAELIVSEVVRRHTPSHDYQHQPGACPSPALLAAGDNLARLLRCASDLAEPVGAPDALAAWERLALPAAAAPRNTETPPVPVPLSAGIGMTPAEASRNRLCGQVNAGMRCARPAGHPKPCNPPAPCVPGCEHTYALDGAGIRSCIHCRRGAP